MDYLEEAKSNLERACSSMRGEHIERAQLLMAASHAMATIALIERLDTLTRVLIAMSIASPVEIDRVL